MLLKGGGENKFQMITILILKILRLQPNNPRRKSQHAEDLKSRYTCKIFIFNNQYYQPATKYKILLNSCFHRGQTEVKMQCTAVDNKHNLLCNTASFRYQPINIAQSNTCILALLYVRVQRTWN